MKRIFLFGMVASMLFSCSTEEETYGVSEQQNTIEVSTYIKQGTRTASKDVFVEGDILGLYACRTTGGYANAYSANFMNNVAVTKGAAGWSYSPLASWPTDAEEHLSFIAWYPRSSSSSAQTYPFTVGVDANGHQIDPMWCSVKDARISDRNGTAINGNETDASFEPNSGPLNLKFNHILSRVKAQVKLDADYPGITVKLNSLKLNSIYKNGSYRVANDLASGSWSYTGSLYVYTLKDSGAEDVVLSSAATSLCDTLMIPQIVSNTPASFTITYTHTLAEGGEKTVNKTLYLPNSWEQNKIYNYTISLSLDVNNITITAEVKNMEDATTPTIGDTPAEPIDLGLSVKWASHDFGATSPYMDSPKFVFTDNPPRNSSGLSNSQDRAFSWGANWSTPTRTQWYELRNNCTWTETTIEGIEGYIITATNGNSIFLKRQGYWTKDYAWGTNSRYAPYYYVLGAGSATLSDYYSYTNVTSVRYSVRPVFK